MHYTPPNHHSPSLLSPRSGSAVSLWFSTSTCCKKQGLSFVVLFCAEKRRKDPKRTPFHSFFPARRLPALGCADCCSQPRGPPAPRESSSQSQGWGATPARTEALPSPALRRKSRGFALFKLNSSPSSLSEASQMRDRLTVNSHHQHPACL